MDNQIQEEVKAVRSDVLMELGEKMKEEYTDSFIGEIKEVLMEEETEIDGVKYMVGHTREYVRIAVVGDSGLGNKMADVKVKKRINNEILLADIQKMY